MLKKVLSRIKNFIKKTEVKSLIALIPAIIVFCLSYSNPIILSFSIVWQFALPIIIITACYLSGRDYLSNGFLEFKKVIKKLKKIKELRSIIQYKDFFSSLSHELKMDSLITLSVVSSLVYALVLGPLAPIVIYAAPLFTLAALHVSNSLKKFIDKWTEGATRKKIDYLLAEKVGIEELINRTEEGDEFAIKSDESKSTYILVDGRLLSEQAEINEGTIVSGEADKTVIYPKGKVIYAGTRYVGGGEIRIEACYAGSQSNIYKKIQSVISHSKSAAQRSVNKYLNQISIWFVPLVILVAVIAFLAWGFIVGFGFGFAVAMDILFAACPCALAIAGSIPYALLKAMLFNSNIVVHDESLVDQLDTVDAVVFDKTGTLTTLSVKDIVVLQSPELSGLSLDKNDENLILSLVKYAERCKLKLKKETKDKQDGFIKDNFADAIVSSDKFSELIVSNLENLIQEIDTKNQDGLIISVKDKKFTKVFVGSASFLTRQGIACAIDSENPSAVFIGLEVGGEGSGSKIPFAKVNFDQQVRPDARSTIELLYARKIAVHMLTGDNLQSAELIANQLGIDVKNIKADCKISASSESESASDTEQKLDDKAAYVADLVANNRKVLVVGDGWNDAKAAGQANSGSLAMGLTSDMSGFFSGTIDKLSDIFKLKAAFAKFKIIQKQVLAFSVLYIFLAMFLAAVVFPMYGMVTMMGCFGICMAFSSCFALAWSSLLIPMVKKVLSSPKEKTANPAPTKPVFGYDSAQIQPPARRSKAELYTLYKKTKPKARAEEDSNKTWYRFEVTKETSCCQMDARKGKCTEIENQFGLTRDSLRFDKNKIEFDCEVDDQLKNAISARLVELFDTESVSVIPASGKSISGRPAGRPYMVSLV